MVIPTGLSGECCVDSKNLSLYYRGGLGFDMSGRYKSFPFILFLFYSACVLCPGHFAFVSPIKQQQMATDNKAEQPCDHSRQRKSGHQRCQLANEYLPSQKTTVSAEMAVQCGVPQSLEPVAAVLRPVTLLPQHPPNLSPQPVSLFIKLRI